MEKERILLPQSFGDNVRWYNYQVIRTDVDGDPNNLSTVIATGTVGWDCLPNVSRFGAQNQAGDAARGSAGVYLLELLSLTNDDVLKK